MALSDEQVYMIQSVVRGLEKEATWLVEQITRLNEGIEEAGGAPGGWLSEALVVAGTLQTKIACARVQWDGVKTDLSPFGVTTEEQDDKDGE